MSNLPAERMEGKKTPLAKLPADPFSGRMDLDDEELVVVHDYFDRMRYYPVVTSILKCSGQSCEFVTKCPLARLNKLPTLGSDCPVELALIEMWVSDLVRQLEIDPEDVIDQAQVRELVSYYMYEKRIGEKLAERPLLVDAFRSMTLGGEAITEEKLNPLYLAIERNHKMRDRVMGALNSTREAKSKDKSRHQVTADQYAAALMKRAKEMSKELADMRKVKPIEAKVTSIPASMPQAEPEPDEDEEYDPSLYEDTEPEEDEFSDYETVSE